MPRQARKRSNTQISHVMLREINRKQIFEDNDVCCGIYSYSQGLMIFSALHFKVRFFIFSNNLKTNCK